MQDAHDVEGNTDLVSGGEALWDYANDCGGR